MDKFEFDSLTLVITLSDLAGEKAFKYFTLLMGFKKVFEVLGIEVVVLTSTQSQQTRYEAPFRCFYAPEKIEKLNAIKKKVIFGKERTIVYTYMYLFEKNKNLCWIKRINYDNLMEVCQRALEIRYKEASKKLKNLVDIPRTFR